MIINELNKKFINTRNLHLGNGVANYVFRVKSIFRFFFSRALWRIQLRDQIHAFTTPSVVRVYVLIIGEICRKTYQLLCS